MRKGEDQRRTLGCDITGQMEEDMPGKHRYEPTRGSKGGSWRAFRQAAAPKGAVFNASVLHASGCAEPSFLFCCFSVSPLVLLKD